MRVKKLVALVVAVMCGSLLTGCFGGGSSVPSQLQSSGKDLFRVVDYGGKRWAVGHGVAFALAEDWVSYGDEIDPTSPGVEPSPSDELGVPRTTYEWAYGLPEDTEPLPSGIQTSMAIPGKGDPLDAVFFAAKALVEVSAKDEILDEGDIEIEGAIAAKFLRFERDFEYRGKKSRIEQVSLFVETSERRTSTIRFISTPELWEKTMKESFESTLVGLVESEES